MQTYEPDSRLGSQLSIDPDRIDRRNNERLRKRKNLSGEFRIHSTWRHKPEAAYNHVKHCGFLFFVGDDYSLADPDDILDRFMARQTHARSFEILKFPW